MSESMGTRYLAAWDTHTAAAVGDFMDEDVDFEDLPLGQKLQGRKEVEQFVEQFDQTFSSDYRFTLVTEFVTDSTMALEWTVSGTHDRTSPALPATGKPFNIRGATIARLRNGKITYNRDYADMAAFLRQIGVLPSD
jgi:steroid delta-isomerase-like uncharacterized protein